MNTIIIYVLSIGLIFLGMSTYKNKTNNIKKFISSINKSYSKLININGNIIKWLLISVILSIIILILCEAINRALIIGGGWLQIIVISFLLFIFVIVNMYFIFGIPLLMFSKVEKLINSIKNNAISFKLLVSFLILMIYSIYFCILKKDISNYNVIICIGLLVSYILNIEMLINVIMNPLCFFEEGGKKLEEYTDGKTILKITLMSCILLVVLILINMFLVVLITYYNNEKSYLSSNEINVFDLFYYTIISFTTIGYGDIIPGTIISQVVSIIIAFTSVLCLTIFISSVLSVKDRIESESNKDKVITNKNKSLLVLKRYIDDIKKNINFKKFKYIRQEREEGFKDISLNLIEYNLKNSINNIDKNAITKAIEDINWIKTNIVSLKNICSIVYQDNIKNINFINNLKQSANQSTFTKRIDNINDKIKIVLNSIEIVNINMKIEARKADYKNDVIFTSANEINNISEKLKEISRYISELENNIETYENKICIYTAKKMDIKNTDIGIIKIDIDNYCKMLKECNEKYTNFFEEVENLINIITTDMQKN